jgi:hypothetical protein
MALKGGSNNFGIVTRIEFPTFPQGIMWGGTTFYPGSVLPELCSTLVRFATNPDPDENANVLVSYGWAASVGMEMAVSSLYHGKPTELEEFPASLDTFVAIEPKLRSTIRKDSVLAFTEEQGSHSKDGSRSLYFTTSIKPDLEFLLQVRDIYLKAVEKVKDVQNLAFAIVMQPITKNFLQRSNQAGENAMGLRPEDGPMVNLMLNPVWEDAKDDERIIDLCLALIRKIDERALEDGKAVRWRFLNYGYRTQNVIESYGEERIQTLRDVSHKYDPSGFFQKNVPGGFKLPLS